MLELLAAYSVEEILVFIVMLAVAIKGVVSFIDWANKRLKEHFGQANDDDKRLNDLTTRQDNMEKHLDKIDEKLDLLIASDKDDIKSFIVREHHYFCYQKKWIDDYSLDCLEKRYTHYEKENGNSFVLNLMNEVRALPKKPFNNNEED